MAKILYVIHMKTRSKSSKVAWAVVLFYLLIAFEFFYMASPFAIYFYSVYKPGISFLNHFPQLAWLTGFFMPHLVEDTHSGILNIMPFVGIILAGAGFIMFLVCAAQVYYAKLFRKGAVTKGLYKYIQHPQYTAFSICSFGMLLVWPRFLTLLFFVTLLFVYNWLARKEEKECSEKFGEAYTAYCTLTYRFIPIKFPHTLMSFKFPQWSLYILSLVVAFAISMLIKQYSISNLYAYNDKTGHWISIYETEKSTLADLSCLINEDKTVDSLIFAKTNGSEIVNYVVPAEMFISEIPMIEPENEVCHVYGNRYETSKVKVIVTQCLHKQNEILTGEKLIRKALTLKPIAEVLIDVNQSKILKVIDLPDKLRYNNIPEPIF